MTRARGAAALGVALCLVAGAFAATPLYVPGVALVLLAVVAAAWVSLAGRGAAVARTLDRAAVPEGDPVRVNVRIVRSRVPMPGSDLRAWAEGPSLELPRDGRQTAEATLRPGRRGRHRLGAASLEIADPLGLCRRTVTSAVDEVIVLPRVEPVQPIELGGNAAGWPGAGAGEAVAGATEIDSLQPHRPGTPASRIHWPTVARTATLMERRLVADAEQVPLVVVDPRAPASRDALDRALRAAASLCVHLGRCGGCSLLLPGDRRPAAIDAELCGFMQAHVQLALLSPEAGGPPVGGLSGAASVVWVSAMTAPAGLPAAVRFLVSPHLQSRWPARFAVAGCRGYELAGSGAWSVAV